MEYQVWVEEYEATWSRVDCGDLEVARTEIHLALKRGEEPLLTKMVPYQWSIKIEEVTPDETRKGKTRQDPGPGDKGVSPVRSPDVGDVSELG